MKYKELKAPGIYCLKHPETKEVRYVGQSKNIRKRYLDGHLRSPRTSNYPVSRWVNKLLDLGLTPEIEVLEYCNNPIDSEKMWIDKFKAEGARLLNIHGGGPMPAATGNGVTTKIWSVRGMPTPWIFLCRTLFPMRDRESISNALSIMREDRRSRKTEFDKLQFELRCARILLEQYSANSKQVKFAEKWLMDVSDKVNKKYPKTIIIMSPDGEQLV